MMPARFVELRPYVILLGITLIARIITALPLEHAGYMDASYTIHVAENLARGRGFTEDVLWNYLDHPEGLPHPSNLYWMPLPSLLVVPFFVLFGVSYHAAQIPFILLSLLLPLLAFRISRLIFARDDYAWSAALFTAFSGFYTVYWVSPDNFAVFAVTAAACLFAIASGIQTQSVRYFLLAGIMAGLSHLSRADGILLLAAGPAALILARDQVPNRRRIAVLLLWLVAGYAVVMTPWFLRNYLVAGSLLPSAGTKTLWLTNYDELFRYADDLTAERYLAWGLGPIIGSKLYAAGLNLLVIAFGALQIFLAPFSVIGMWQLRKRLEFLPFFIYALLLYVTLTFGFTFPSWRGSILHSSASLLPFLAVATAPGIDSAIRWIARRRRTWDAPLAHHVFQFGFVGLAVFLSLFLYAQGIFGSTTGVATSTPLWNARDAEYVDVGRWLDAHAEKDDIVMVADPPSFYNMSHRPAIVIPTDGIASVLSAGRQYRAKYLVMQFDYSKLYGDLYAGTPAVPGLRRVADFRDALSRPVTLYEFNE